MDFFELALELALEPERERLLDLALDDPPPGDLLRPLLPALFELLELLPLRERERALLLFCAPLLAFPRLDLERGPGVLDRF